MKAESQQNGSQLCVTSYVLRRAGVCPHGKILLIIFPLLWVHWYEPWFSVSFLLAVYTVGYSRCCESMCVNHLEDFVSVCVHNLSPCSTRSQKLLLRWRSHFKPSWRSWRQRRRVMWSVIRADSWHMCTLWMTRTWIAVMCCPYLELLVKWGHDYVIGHVVLNKVRLGSHETRLHPLCRRLAPKLVAGSSRPHFSFKQRSIEELSNGSKCTRAGHCHWLRIAMVTWDVCLKVAGL